MLQNIFQFLWKSDFSANHWESIINIDHYVKVKNWEKYWAPSSLSTLTFLILWIWNNSGWNWSEIHIFKIMAMISICLYTHLSNLFLCETFNLSIQSCKISIESQITTYATPITMRKKLFGLKVTSKRNSFGKKVIILCERYLS